MTFNEFWESWGIPDGAFLEGKEYAEWLWDEALKNAPKKAEHNTAYAKCQYEIMELFNSGNAIFNSAVLKILKKHFA